MKLWKALPTALLVLIPSFVIVQDYRSARYGNGVFSHYTELAHGAHLTYINGSLITQGRANDFSAIVWPGSELTTAEGDTIRITKVLRYATGQGGLYLAVESTPPTMLVFTSPVDVQRAEPKTVHDAPPLEWIDLENKPALVYYWRVIVIVLLLLEAAIAVWIVGRFLRRK